MSYRTFKQLLGETSLERKCRYIFAGGILLLITGSFYWYGQRTESLVIGQTIHTARLQIREVFQDLHFKNWVDKHGDDFRRVIDQLSEDLKRDEDVPAFRQHLIFPKGEKARDNNKLDLSERTALAAFIAATAKPQDVAGPDGKPRLKKPYFFADGSPMEYWRIVSDRKEFQYVQALMYQRGCLTAGCHDTPQAMANGKFSLDPPREGELAAAVVVNLPMESTNKAIHQNRAMLIATALFTAILAMIASFVIVRYVIVKPVKHLRDVSDAIAAGRLNVRAQIQTGDEFEELSHAFNRMLHNLVAMQQELRQVNGDLDKKVDELAQANLALFEMNRLKSDFLATMSHELRTPLNSIIGFSEVLSGSDQLNERQKRYAANIQTSGKMLLGMINDILDLAKIESGKMEVRTEDFSIRDVCEALAAVARPVAERKEIDLECRLDDAIPLLRQDPGKLRQIIYNLLSNAIKFTPEGGRVSLRAQAEGRFVVIAVADTGIGIAEEDRDKIFEKFRQAGTPGAPGNVLTREHQGTGLGLSIVRELTRLLGGDVHLESRPGQGSTFTVRIPLQLPGNRKFEVNLSDERIDLSKARRVEPRVGTPHLPSPPPPPTLPSPPSSSPPRRGAAEPAADGRPWGR